VNYIEVYVRKGLYRLIEPPAVPGVEVDGVVKMLGPAHRALVSRQTTGAIVLLP
jgi:NADPH:quinone reductase-like Zn-dependent oxidoreductase